MITRQRLVKRAHFHQMELQSSVFLRTCAYLRTLVISCDQPPLTDPVAPPTLDFIQGRGWSQPHQKIDVHEKQTYSR